jgi:hypothetical protein
LLAKPREQGESAGSLTPIDQIVRACLGISGMKGNEGHWGGEISIISQNFSKFPSILFHPLESSISQTSSKTEKGPLHNHTKQWFPIRYQPEAPLHGKGVATSANKRIILGQDTIKLEILLLLISPETAYLTPRMKNDAVVTTPAGCREPFFL